MDELLSDKPNIPELEQIAQTLSPEQVQELQILLDPDKWAYVYFGWESYDYQKPILKMLPESQLSVFRFGRRLGKCLPGYVRILDPITGERPTVIDLFHRQKATVVSMDNDSLITKDTTIIFENGIKEVFRVKLKSGRYIDATGNHPLYKQYNGWTEVSNLRYGDKVAIPSALPYFNNQGCRNSDIELLTYISDSVDAPYVPEPVFRLCKQDMIVYLDSIITIPGYISGKPQFLSDIQHLLLRFGIHASIRRDVLLYPLEEHRKLSLVSEEPTIDYEPIVSIESLGMMPTYDLTVPDTHNFVANDIITHNTEIMSILILWYAFTQYNKQENLNSSNEQQYDILIVAPYDKQIDLIFKRLNQLLDASPKYQSAVKKSIKHNIVLNNGTNILGMTAGTKNNSGAEGTRGQRADVLVVDEADYLSEDDLSNIRNILNEDPGRIRMIVASTPSGKRVSYYHWCQEASHHYHADTAYLKLTGNVRFKHSTAIDHGHKGNGWNEFYAPSDLNRKLLEINPTTGQSYMDDLKDQLPQYRYEQEVLALFGDELAGVYQKRFIDQAVQFGIDRNVRYAKRQYRQLVAGNYRFLGVDWDKISAETSLLAIEWNAKEQRFYMLDKVAIPRGEYTFQLAVETIIDLDKLHCFDWIVVDRGYGDNQVEQLKLYGLANPETNMHKKLIPIHFASKIQVRDPVTRQIEDKDMKPYMVSNSVLMFERGMIALDPTDRQLIEQLEGYIIKRVSQDGKPIYSDENEHFVDALNLALIGFSMKYDTLLQQRLSSKIVSMPILDQTLFDPTHAVGMTPGMKTLNAIPNAVVSVPLSNTDIDSINKQSFTRLPITLGGKANKFQRRTTF